MDTCPFCTKPKVRERAIVENDLVFAFLTNIPITPGHALVCPKRCAPTFDDMNRDEARAVFELRGTVATALQKTVGAEGFNYAWNENEVAGQSVPHFHLHIVPRTKGDAGITEHEPRQFLYRPGSRAESPDEELHAMTEQIRSSI